MHKLLTATALVALTATSTSIPTDTSADRSYADLMLS